MKSVHRRSPVKPRLPVLLVVLAALAGASLATAREAPERTAPAAARQADWLARASDLERNRDWQGLLDWAGHWTRAEPGNATAWFALGRAYSKLRRYPEAIEAYRRDLAIEPGDVYALNNLGNVYRDSNQFREAVMAYRDAVQIDPGYIPAWHNLGLTLFTLKGVAGVTQALQKLSSSDPDLAEAWRRLIIEYSLSRDPRVAQKAIDVLRGLDADKRRRMFEILFVSV